MYQCVKIFSRLACRPVASFATRDSQKRILADERRCRWYAVAASIFWPQLSGVEAFL